MTSTDFILEWLHGTLENHWIDAKCGDDICERPFEFAFYGRFGCRADCGTYIDQMQVTGIQVDLYYNFRHVTSKCSQSPLRSTQAAGTVCLCVCACGPCARRRSDQDAGRLNSHRVRKPNADSLRPARWFFASLPASGSSDPVRAQERQLTLALLRVLGCVPVQVRLRRRR